MEVNGFDHLMRAHQLCMDGYQVILLYISSELGHALSFIYI